MKKLNSRVKNELEATVDFASGKPLWRTPAGCWMGEVRDAASGIQCSLRPPGRNLSTLDVTGLLTEDGKFRQA
jgi:hypothetical protein